MTEDRAFEILTCRMTPLDLYRERSGDGILRETTERCSPEVRDLAARRLERALSEGGDALAGLWRGSKAAFFMPVDQLPSATRAWIAALRDPGIVSKPWSEPIVTLADD